MAALLLCLFCAVCAFMAAPIIGAAYSWFLIGLLLIGAALFAVSRFGGSL